VPDPTPLAVAKAFSTLCAALAGVKSAYHYMPEEYEGLPAVAMLPRRVRQDDVFTGPATENVWTWAVHIVLPLGGRVAGSDYQQAQEALYTILPLVLGTVRANPDLGGLATKAATLEDLGEEPDLDEDAGQLVKILELTATTAEV
jgi:hypothetical protein